MDYCTHWKPVVGTQLATWIAYGVFFSVYSKRWKPTWWLTVIISLILVAGMLYVVYRKVAGCPLNEKMPQHNAVILIITFLAVVVCVLTYWYGAESESEANSAAVDSKKPTSTEKTTEPDSDTDQDSDQDSDQDRDQDRDPPSEGTGASGVEVLKDVNSFEARKKYCESLPNSERHTNVACDSSNDYRADLEEFKSSHFGVIKRSPEELLQIEESFRRCDADQNNWITPDEPPCTLAQKSTKYDGDGFDEGNTHSSGCQLPNKGESMDKFLECMGR